MDTTPDTSWKRFFEALGPEGYLSETFTKNTDAEVDFVMDVCGLTPGMKILDMGCGPGRHALGLAKRGLNVVGVDFSDKFIEFATAAAAECGVADRTEFVVADARDFVRARTFDAAVCLCEGGFALLQTDEDNVRVLRHIAASLKPGAPFLLTTMNGYRTIRLAGSATDTVLDSTTMVESWIQDDGTELKGRHFIVPELARMHRQASLTVEAVWGGTAGTWGRRPLEWDEMEVMFFSRKVGINTNP